MAYMSQAHKAEIVNVIKPILKKYGVKATFGVRNHSTIVMNIKSGSIDFIENYNKVAPKKHYGHFEFRPAVDHIDVNTYGTYKDQFDGVALEFLKEVVPALHGPRYFDDSEPMTDYFHCSHYIDLNIGTWEKAYIVEN